MSCHRRVNVLEDLDIAPFPAPKPRVVSLEPLSRKTKGKIKQRTNHKDQVKEAPPPAQSSNAILGNELNPPLSPAPSEVSGSSRLSASSQSFQVTTDVQSNRSASMRSEIPTSAASITEKTITATTELLRAGGLPGDTVPVKINIQHTKQVRSPYGIIVTLYRQGRIDMHPPLPVRSPGSDGKMVYEDCLPKSRTGLSGLSFGTTRSSSVFRKDLSQTFAPLIVDPVTLTANVKTSIRIPEDAFPTISRVPGGMISFRYYVEVVVDLRGKLAAGDRYLPRLNMVSSGPNLSTPGQVTGDGTGTTITSNWAGNILDTDPIRRERGVVAIVFEIVVGTKDSQRSKIKNIEETNSGVNPVPVPSDQLESGDGYWNSEGYFVPNNELYDHDDYENGHYYENGDYSNYENGYWPAYPAAEEQPYQSLSEVLHPPPPPPPPQPTEPLDEKARLRHEETMLLPSQPPEQGQSGPSNTVDSMPTAPAINEDDQGYETFQAPDGQEDLASASSMFSALSINTILPSSSTSTAHPSLMNNHVSLSPHDDKHELERQRMLMEASAPESGTSETGGCHDEPALPSAPVLDDDDLPVGLGQEADEALPQYQR